MGGENIFHIAKYCIPLSQFCASSANTIMLVANATTDHTRRRVTTCQESRDFDAMQHTLIVKKGHVLIKNHFKSTLIHPNCYIFKN